MRGPAPLARGRGRCRRSRAPGPSTWLGGRAASGARGRRPTRPTSRSVDLRHASAHRIAGALVHDLRGEHRPRRAPGDLVARVVAMGAHDLEQRRLELGARRERVCDEQDPASPSHSPRRNSSSAKSGCRRNCAGRLAATSLQSRRSSRPPRRARARAAPRSGVPAAPRHRLAAVSGSRGLPPGPARGHSDSGENAPSVWPRSRRWPRGGRALHPTASRSVARASRGRTSSAAAARAQLWRTLNARWPTVIHAVSQQ